MSDRIAPLIAKSNLRDFGDLAKLLTEIERNGEVAATQKALFECEHPAFRIGITGPPGAGKSTLVATMAKSFSQRGLKVAVLAVDPSSPFTNGALLGDRIRFLDVFNDQNVFIRSVGSRGSSGGLSASSYLMLRAFDLWNFDIVIIETVGVGQTELEVMFAADVVAVVLVPESGDSIQAMKAGLLEISDLFVVNKSDRPGSEIFAKELRESMAFSEEDVLGEPPKESHVEVLLTSNKEPESTEILAGRILARKKSDWIKKRQSPKRLQAEARSILWMKHMGAIQKAISKISSAKDLQKAIAKS